MLELEHTDGKAFLVSDDRGAENALVSEAAETIDFGIRWDATEMKDGKLRVEVYPYEAREVSDALAFSPNTQHYMDVCEELNAFYKEED